MKRIVCFHLFNDYSGSPKVLGMVLKGLLKEGYAVELITSDGGVLDELLAYSNLKKHSYSYCFSSNPIVTMFRYMAIQLYTFFFAMRYLLGKNTIFYINTLLPVGPALAGWLLGKRVVYHYHENAFIKGAFYKTLCCCMQWIASEIICVSNYQRSFLKRKKNIIVIPNAVPQEFVKCLKPSLKEAFHRKRVLMLGSLKLYKGTLEFIQLAQCLSQYSFDLVINDAEINIKKFLKEHHIKSISNLNIYPRQDNVVPFYNNASLVLNLSNKEKILETFGLTVIEAMSAGLPVIVPTVGGIAEMVEDGVNGYKIDVQDFDRIVEVVDKILSDKTLYIHLSQNALLCSKQYDAVNMINKIIQILSTH